MTMIRTISMLSIAVLVLLGTSNANAQKYEYNNKSGKGHSTNKGNNYNGGKSSSINKAVDYYKKHNGGSYNNNNSHHNNNSHRNSHGTYNSNKINSHYIDNRYFKNSHSNTNRHSGHTYHYDNNDHVIRNKYGHAIGKYQHNVFKQDSRYILPHHGNNHHGSYYYNGGSYWYYPQTDTHNAYANHKPVQIKYGGWSQYEDLSGRFEELCNEFCLDLYYNYQHNPGFKETYRQAYNLLTTAQWIHAPEHRNDRNGIKSRLKGLDAGYYGLLNDCQGWTRQQRKQVGNLHVESKLDLIETSLLHLMNDVGVERTPQHVINEKAPAPAAFEKAPSPDSFAPLKP